MHVQILTTDGDHVTYRIYLLHPDSQISEKTDTANPFAAKEAFSSLVNRTGLDGEKMAAVLTHNNKRVAFHRFDQRPGHTLYWRDRLNDIPC